MQVIELYKFQNLNEWMNKNNFPQVEKKEDENLVVFEVTKQSVEEGHIIFKEDGIYWKINGKVIKGFVYISHYSVYYNEKIPNFPKFHIAKCKTIQDFLNNDKFNLRYEFSNNKYVDIVDISNRRMYKKVYKNMKLKLCKFCQKLTEINEINTEDYISKIY